MKAWAENGMERNPPTHTDWRGNPCNNHNERLDFLLCHASPVCLSLKLPSTHFENGGKCLPIAALKDLLVSPIFCRVLCKGCDQDNNYEYELLQTALKVEGVPSLYAEFAGGLQFIQQRAQQAQETRKNSACTR
jgi:hypothetical protein